MFEDSVEFSRLSQLATQPIGHLVVADIEAKIVIFNPIERRIIRWIS